MVDAGRAALAQPLPARRRRRLEPLMTWEELQQNRGPGYDTHHVVERWSENDGIQPSMIYASDNEVPVPTLKHWEINA